jgi:hypothetical protein
MSYHLLALQASVGNTPNTLLAPVTDDVVTIKDGRFLLREDRFLLWAAALSANMLRARVVTPSFRQVALPFIQPVTRAVVFGSPPRVARYDVAGPRVRGVEELVVDVTSGIASGTEPAYALLALEGRRDPAPIGDYYTVRGTSTTPSGTNVWTTLNVTWDELLPPGEYAVVGLRGEGAGAVAYRLIFEGQSDRPGVPAVTGPDGLDLDWLRLGRYGAFGRFQSYAQPLVQVLASAATATHNIYLDVVRLR